MFPSPQDALPLPPRPNLEQYKKQAKNLLKACKSGSPESIRTWATSWIGKLVVLKDLTITAGLPVRIERWVDQVEEFAGRKLLGANAGNSPCVLADAQFVIARSHGFESWPKLVKHITSISCANSLVSTFELAADAVVAGDLANVEQMLRENPELIRARSTREHQATLLHYLAANGVEGYRQKTPKNAVEIAKALLRTGAEVDAEARVYSGRATTLELVATSVHPERAGVQEQLMEILLDNGAAISRPGKDGHENNVVAACLKNGRAKAAEFLARRGAELDLEAAAGVGQLDAVKTFFGKDGGLKSNATKAKMERGFLWACKYGRNAVVEFLVDKGVDLTAQANTGQTGLHWAVIGGQLETIHLLLNRGASLEARNSYGGTALGQALWSAVNGETGIDYFQIIEALLDAGATIEDDSLAWLAQQKDGSATVRARIAEVLRGRGAKS